MSAPEFCFITDTREKEGSRWELPQAKIAKLDVGDYSVEGYEPVMAIERKGFDDLFKCLGVDLRRFRKQMIALGKLRYKALMIESTANSISYGHPISKIKGAEAMTRLIHLCVTSSVPLVFCDRHGASMCASFLVEFWQSEQKADYHEGVVKAKREAKSAKEAKRTSPAGEGSRPRTNSKGGSRTTQKK